ncbi:MAG: hypothetical protein ACYTGB_00655 [Planctomycetota bacterium]
MKLVTAGLAVMLTAVIAARAAEEGEAEARPAGVPAGAETWLVVPTPKESIDRATKLVESFQPGAGALTEQTLRGWLVRNGGDALDDTKPLVAIFSLDEKSKYAVSVGLKAGADAAKGLEVRFGKAAKTEDGVSTYLEVQGGALPDKEVFALVKDGRLVLGDDLALVKLLAGAAAPGADAYPKGVDVLAGMDVKTVSARHKEKIEETLKKLETAPEDVIPGPPGMKANIDKNGMAALARLARSSLEEVRQLGAEARIGEEVSLAFSGAAVPDGELAGALEKLGAAKLPDAKLLPGGAVMALAASIPPEVTAKLMATVKELVEATVAGEGGELDEAVKKDVTAYIAALTELTGKTDGTVIEAIMRRDGGLCGLIASGVKGEGAREALVKAVKLSTAPGLSKMWDDQGMKAEFTEKHRKSGDLDVDKLSVDFKPKANPDVPPEMQAQIQEMQRKMVEAIYGLPLVYEMAVSDKYIFAGFGKKGAEELDKLVAAAAGGGEGQALVATRKRAPQGAFVIGEVSVLEMARLMIDVFSRNVPVGAMPALDLGDGPGKLATFWASAAGGKMEVRYNVPVEPIKKIFDEIQKARKQMMQPPPPQPVPLPGDVPDVEGF